MRILMLLLMLCASLNSYGHSEQRIIALAPHIVENLYAIGAGEHIVATVEHADYPQAAQDIPVLVVIMAFKLKRYWHYNQP